MTPLTQPMRQPPVAGVLPKEAQDLLVKASQIKDERQRRISIDHAIDAIKVRFPQFFQPTL